MDQSYQKNITRYLILSILRGMSVSTSIVLWVIFLQRQYGFNLTQVVLLDIPFWIGKFIFEIPTGVVADKFGRKLSLAISAVMSSVIWMVFAISNSFAMLAVAQVFGAMAATFSSGADEALLFESMQALGREDEYAKISGRAKAVETVSAMISGVAVGLIAQVNIVLPVILTSFLIALTLIPILSMKETGARPAKSGDGEAKPASYMQIVRHAFGALRDHATLRWAAAYLLILSCVSFYSATFLQPYTIALGLSVAMLGPVMVGVQLMTIGGSLSVNRVQKALGDRTLLFGVPLMLVPCLLVIGMARVVPVLGVVGLASFLFSLTQPVLMAVLQSKVTNEARATLLSIQSLLATIFLILTEPALGVVSDLYGVHSSYLVMAALVALFCFPLLWKGRRWLANGSLATGAVAVEAAGLAGQGERNA